MLCKKWRSRFFLHFFENFFCKSFAVRKKALPLHSLSGSNTVVTETQDDPWQHSIQTKQYKLASFFYEIEAEITSKVRNEKRTVDIIWHTLIPASTNNINQSISPFGFSDIKLQRRVWSWLRMNASYRLNTCKSRGLLRQTSGARVSNAYPTCPSYWDSLSKGRLIPNNMRKLPDFLMKAPAMKDGDAFH